MKDVLVIAIVIGFFAVCAAYVIWCERVLAADAPDRVGTDATYVGRAASTAGAADTVSMAGLPNAAGASSVGGRDVREQ